MTLVSVDVGAQKDFGALVVVDARISERAEDSSGVDLEAQQFLWALI